jgi:hypothetical protein
VKWTSWATAVGLLSIVSVVVYTSFHEAGVRCEVCIRFADREACRAVDGATEEEARRAAVTNTCANLTSGVTNSLACERTTPLREHCAPE